MTFPTEIHLSGQTYVQKLGEAIQAYRVPHDIERVNMNAIHSDFRYRGNVPGFENALRLGPPRQSVLDTGDALPEVYRLDPEHSTLLMCPAQKMWWGLNSGLPARRQSTLLGNAFALTNNTGFPGHYNCLTGEGKDLGYPKFDQPRVCGGAVLFGTEKDGLLLISSMLSTNAILPASEVLKHIEWWYWVVSINPQGEINLITRPAADGSRIPVRAPLLTAKPVTLPLVELHRLPPGFIPPSAKWMP